MTVGRIRKEAKLARFVAPLLEEAEREVRPIDRLAAVRRAVAQDPAYAWALTPPSPPDRDARNRSIFAIVLSFIFPFIRTYLWPAGLLLAAVFLAALMLCGDIGDAIKVTITAFFITVAAIVAGAGLLYLALRRQEANDWVDERSPDAATLRDISDRENHFAQNHMISLTTRKPGLVRWFTARLGFWVILMMATKEYKPGHLGTIATIHAARWITVPGTRNLIFLSNYGGSWESYLEDFITRAHAGLTAIWSNSIGFPRSRNLFQDGATDGERFKRYARASMLPTRFWYSAYPEITTEHIRTNAEMRRGLTGALTNDEAKQWLALFGSVPRPDAKLESNEIQSLLFGGLGFMPAGTCLLFRLPEGKDKAREWVRSLYSHTAFGDGRKLKKHAILTVGLGAGALERLGLPPECVGSFRPAFVEGMGRAGRARILGDVGENAPEKWEWGRDPYDVVLLVYGHDDPAVAALAATVETAAKAAGMAPPHRIPLVPAKKPAIEPFGFVDGVSQPVIRGSYQSFRKNDPLHLVEPGEFILGYPDNRCNFPPEPELSPLLDPQNHLPVAEKSYEFGNSIVEAPRAIGRNGSFLVIRQLEQDVSGFWDYCRSESRRLENRLPPPYDMRPDYIAAKLIGRWCDGSSMVRNPYYPFPDEQKARKDRRQRRPTAKGYDEASAIAAAGEPVGSETARPQTNPPVGQAISAPPEPSHKGDNDFLFGVEDPQALRCPLGAHIRRANPRDSLVPGSREQVEISNRHRILRVGRLYDPAEGRNPGLLFMCLNGDIERQFEFIQQTWLASPAFHGLAGEQDPLTGSGGSGASGYLIPSMDGPVRLKPLPRFVRTLGGGYFFMPSRSMLAYLGGV